MISAHSDPPPAASFCAGATSAAGAFSGSAGAVAAALPGVEPAGMAIVSSVSSGGMQLVSSQSIHSIWALTEDSGTVSFTRWANRAFPAKVPISISKVLS